MFELPLYVNKNTERRRLEWPNRKYEYNEEQLRVGGQMQIDENLWLLLFGTISHLKKELFTKKK